MGFFSSTKSYIGVDIGNSAIKLVELAPYGSRTRLVTYGYVEVESNIARSSTPETEQQVATVIKQVYEKSKMQSPKSIVALPNFSVFSSIISLPVMSKKELAQAVTWEAKKFVPLPIEEMVLDWRTLSANEGSAKKDGSEDDEEEHKGFKIKSKKKKSGYQRILITAAPKDLVERYVRIFKYAGLGLLAMETESFALERSLVGKDPAVIMIVDLGSFSTDISIVESGIPILSRSIDVGGETITQAISRSLSVEKKRAEQFKRDIGFSSGPVNSIPKIIENTISPIINEIKYSFDLFQGRHQDEIVEKIILTGGSSMLPGLIDYLKQILKIQVYVGDPWGRVVYPVELKPVLQELGPRFAIPVGLAMREIV